MKGKNPNGKNPEEGELRGAGQDVANSFSGHRTLGRACIALRHRE